MQALETKIKGCFKFKLNKFSDKRGKFIKLFSHQNFKYLKFDRRIKQINVCTFKKKNILRGFHYQDKPKQETKFAFCVKGSCIVHVLDIRKKSNTFKKNISIKLSENDHYAVLVPKGCPNAFQSVEKNSVLIYYSTNDYYPKYEKKIKFNSSLINIKFPKNLIVSDKDS